MSYKRVLPRDLFNEANLLKCMGKLTLLIEDKMLEGALYHYDGDPFSVSQDESDGSLSLDNVCIFKAGKAGGRIKLRRPLNSREAWPLYASLHDCDEIAVFDENGSITEEFKSFLVF